MGLLNTIYYLVFAKQPIEECLLLSLALNGSTLKLGRLLNYYNSHLEAFLEVVSGIHGL